MRRFKFVLLALFITTPAAAQQLIDLDNDGIPETPILDQLPGGDGTDLDAFDPVIPPMAAPALDENLRAVVVEQLGLRELVACSAGVSTRPLMDQLLWVFNPVGVSGGPLPFYRSCVGKTNLLENDPLSVAFRPELLTPNRLDGDEQRNIWVWLLTAGSPDTGHQRLDDYANDELTEFPVFVVLVGDPRRGQAYHWLAADLCNAFDPLRRCDAVDLKTGRLHPHHVNPVAFANGELEMLVETW